MVSVLVYRFTFLVTRTVRTSAKLHADGTGITFGCFIYFAIKIRLHGDELFLVRGIQHVAIIGL